MAATDGSASRSSRVKDGLASASARSASATARIQAPRLRTTSSKAATTAAATTAAHRTSGGTRGAKAIPKPIDCSYCPSPAILKPDCQSLLTQALEQRGDVHLIGLVVAGQ